MTLYVRELVSRERRIIYGDMSEKVGGTVTVTSQRKAESDHQDAIRCDTGLSEWSFNTDRQPESTSSVCQWNLHIPHSQRVNIRRFPSPLLISAAESFFPHRPAPLNITTTTVHEHGREIQQRFRNSGHRFSVVTTQRRRDEQ